jgi:uncharacterized metal-binding protein YceD (DUF177 family)
MTPELSRPFAIDRMGEATRVTVEATFAEREAVARRLGIVQADGALQARVTQTCVVSNEDFDTEIAEDFDIRFVPEGMESDDIDLDAPDEIPYAGATIDLGEATTEQLALALDPFPKKPGAAVAAGAQEPMPGPFAAVARLPRK